VSRGGGHWGNGSEGDSRGGAQRDSEGESDGGARGNSRGDLQGLSEGNTERNWPCYPDRDSLRYLCRRSEGDPRHNSQDDLQGNLQDDLRDHPQGDLENCARGREDLPALYTGYGRSADFSSNFHIGDVKASPLTAPTPSA
jgi:hypothetical protein